MPAKPFNSLVVLGPTASGKTRLACELAASLEGEVLSFDSRQVYKGLNLGAGKDLSEYLVNGKCIPYHLIDLAEPSEKFYLHHFIQALSKAFTETTNRGHLPILCGGTGLYLDVLRKDFSFTEAPEDPEFRAQVRHLNKSDLLKWLEQFPPSHTQHIDRHSVKRLIRGIEVARYRSSHQFSAKDPAGLYQPYYLGIRMPLPQLHERIRQRLAKRLNDGLVKEVEGLLQKGMTHDRLRELGLEYKYLSLYLCGEIDLEQLFEALFMAIRQLAKRQNTWFRKMEREGVAIHWVEAETRALDLLPQLPHFENA